MNKFYLLAFFLFANIALTAQIVISEIRIDQSGADDDEYFELENTSAAAIDLDDPACDYFYIVIGDGTGGSGTIEVVIDLMGTIPPGGFMTFAESTFSLGGACAAGQLQTVTLNFENSDNVTHLLVKNFTGANADDLDTDDDCALDAAFPGTIVDGVALIENSLPVGTECEYGTDLGLPVIGPDGSFVPAHLGLNPGTDVWTIGTFDEETGTDTPCMPNNTLPIELISFTAKLTNAQQVVLDWVTATELNNDYMLIERSLDGQKFLEIGKVQGAGTSIEAQEYRFIDEIPKTGFNYYRLKQVDLDGSFQYSQLVTANLSSEKTPVTVYPSIATDIIYINSASDIQTVGVFDLNGVEIARPLAVSNLFTSINVNSFQSGMYFIQVQLSTGETQLLRFVKQ